MNPFAFDDLDDLDTEEAILSSCLHLMLAGICGFAGLVVAILDIHVALLIVAVGGVNARLCVRNWRRADALLDRSLAADAAEGVDPFQIREAA